MFDVLIVVDGFALLCIYQRSLSELNIVDSCFARCLLSVLGYFFPDFGCEYVGVGSIIFGEGSDEVMPGLADRGKVVGLIVEG